LARPGWDSTPSAAGRCPVAWRVAPTGSRDTRWPLPTARSRSHDPERVLHPHGERRTWHGSASPHERKMVVRCLTLPVSPSYLPLFLRQADWQTPCVSPEPLIALVL
jgi:hypothetical protein